MTVADRVLMRMFGRPRGLLGRLGGIILARANRTFAQEIVAFLAIRADERVLEVGFGPGVGIALLAKAASRRRIAGIDPSEEMVRQAMARNAAAIGAGLVVLLHGSVESMPFEDDAFDTVLAINSMQVWPDAPAGLRELRRVLRAGGRVALAFTPRSGQPRAGVTDRLGAAGFADAPPGRAARRFLRPGDEKRHGRVRGERPGALDSPEEIVSLITGELGDETRTDSRRAPG